MPNVTFAMAAVPAVKDCCMLIKLYHSAWELLALTVFEAVEMFQGQIRYSGCLYATFVLGTSTIADAHME